MPPKKTPLSSGQVPATTPPAITGASTTTAGFVGPTLSGPTSGTPVLLRSYADFEQIYGTSDDLRFAPHLNHVAHGARAFFAEGGTRLYVARVSATRRAPTLTGYANALARLARRPDISIVAAPGHTAYPAIARGVAQQLVNHAEQIRYRIAVLDTPAGQAPADAQTYRASFNSSFAALYYPWVVVANPAFKPANPASVPVLTLPPSAFVCGVYARTDDTRGVFKAPANVPIQSALRLERMISDAEQGPLNVAGIDCLRSFPSLGNVVWGARTTSSDPEWIYVSVRRFAIYVERSIYAGTQWVVFQPNAEPLWASVRTTVANFLHGEFQRGALQGIAPPEAYFVQCDQTTMTQNDIDNGRLICAVGVAPLRPAEFIIIRIGQKTADATS